MTITIERLRELVSELAPGAFECNVYSKDNYEPCSISEVLDDGSVSIVWLSGGHTSVLIDTIRLSDELQWWEDREIGETIHYYNSHGMWVRGEVVKEGTKIKGLLPTALVGKWDKPRLMWNGTIWRNYHVNKVLNGEVMYPHATNMWERGRFEDFHDDPTTMQPIDLSDPTPTDAEQRIIDRVKRLEDAVYVIDEVLVGLRNDFLEIQGLKRTDSTL